MRMTWLAAVAGLAAALVTSASAQAAVFTYTFTGSAVNILLDNGEFSNSAFTITMVGDTDNLQHVGSADVLALTSAKIDVEGVTSNAAFLGPVSLSLLGRTVGLDAGVRLIDFELPFDAPVFDFTGPYPSVGHEELGFNFSRVETSNGRLSLFRPSGVRFAASGPVVGGIDAVPEPGAWALMISGFGLAGGALRRRKALAA